MCKNGRFAMNRPLFYFFFLLLDFSFDGLEDALFDSDFESPFESDFDSPFVSDFESELLLSSDFDSDEPPSELEPDSLVPDAGLLPL
jgi:hypothetical protein